MGPSGSGKTSFLTTLVGKAYYGVVSGSVSINGQTGWLTDPQYKHLVGFVPQEDVMMRDLTVEENIVRIRNGGCYAPFVTFCSAFYLAGVCSDHKVALFVATSAKARVRQSRYA